MAAYFVLIAAALSRCLPHWMHMTGGGATAAGAGLLFYGASLKANERWKALLAVAVYGMTDYYLTVYAYGYPFHLSAYFMTWAWYAVVVLFASGFLHEHECATRVTGAALLSPTVFFLWSNAAVWASGTLYPPTTAGLGAAYVAGLPFYRNDLVCTLVLCGLLFGAQAVARGFSEKEAVATR